MFVPKSDRCPSWGSSVSVRVSVFIAEDVIIAPMTELSKQSFLSIKLNFIHVWGHV